MLLVGVQPPLTLKPFNQVVYAAAIAASLLHAGIVTDVGHVVTRSGADVTVKELMHGVLVLPHASVAV
jgi:hypothetical protein